MWDATFEAPSGIAPVAVWGSGRYVFAWVVGRKRRCEGDVSRDAFVPFEVPLVDVVLAFVAFVRACVCMPMCLCMYLCVYVQGERCE